MFEVDKEGLRKLISKRGKGPIVSEIVSNAFDEDGVTDVDIVLDYHGLPGSPFAKFSVKDNSTNGFDDLSHSWTLFAESYKKGDVGKRGRFNFGEKMVLAFCREARITSTTGTVIFKDGKRSRSGKKTDYGTEFVSEIRMTVSEFQDAIQYLNRLIVPAGIAVTLNGESLQSREPAMATFELALPTEISNEEGVLSKTVRKTVVEIYKPLPSEDPFLYEMGIPVVELEGKWHVNVMQKVPLNMDRDNVTPAYARKIHTHVFNRMHEELTGEDMNESWVVDATSSEEIEPEAMLDFADKSLGEKRVSYDPSDPESNKIAYSNGANVVHGGLLNRAQWSNLKGVDGGIESAGIAFPSPKPYSDDPNARPVDIISPDKWTPGMRLIQEYTVWLSEKLLGSDVLVTFVNTSNKFVACFAGGPYECSFDYNVKRLGRKWFNGGITVAVDELIIHEFGHYYSGDHLSREYHDALCSLGARLKSLTLDESKKMRSFIKRGESL